jgi:hypothetical protein
LRELRTGIDNLPSFATIKRMYGNAGRMFETHGYRRRSPGAQPGTTDRIYGRDTKGRFVPKAATESSADRFRPSNRTSRAAA